MTNYFVKALSGRAPGGKNSHWYNPSKIVLAAFLCCWSAGAFAHSGHGNGFLNAFAHPFGGADHLLLMLFVGVWAGRSGGITRWLLPSAFLLSMLAGWSLGAQGLLVPGIESGLAATLIVLGVLLALQLQLPRGAQMLAVAAFALLHGLAHGSELTAGGAWSSAAGMLLGTALLHGLGIAATLLIPDRRGVLFRAAGAALALIGGGLLAAG